MISRRQVISGLAAATVVGFNPATGRWVSEAAAAHGHSPIPRLDGELIFDPAVLAAYSSDAGNTVHETPLALLRPGSVEDIVKMVRFAKKFRIKVSARGQGHTTYGQSLVRGGLMIEMAPLGQIHKIGHRSAEVDAGLRWNSLLEETLQHGLMPPVLTGYLGLSIGGTLSVGGVSSGNRRGVQVDHVRRLEVVTGKGDLVECSVHRHRDLFEAALAGLGQCGIITRAEVDLVPAPEQARTYLLHYVDNATFFRDLRKLLARGEFDDLFTLWFPDGAGGWLYQLNAVKFHGPGATPHDNHLLRGLNFDASLLSIQDQPFLQYALTVDVAIDFFRSIGLWDNVRHPWFDVFLPEKAVERYVGEVIPSLQPDDVGMTGFLLLFAFKRHGHARPLFRVPRGEWVFLFDILTSAPAPGPDPAFEARMLKRNRRLYEKARSVGGYRYPIGSTPFSKVDWIRHYGETFPWFVRQKRRYDPACILTPGPDIF